jgi:hypothetical protein
VAPSVFVVLIQGMQRAAVRDELDWIEKVGVRYDKLARAARRGGSQEDITRSRFPLASVSDSPTEDS